MPPMDDEGNIFSGRSFVCPLAPVSRDAVSLLSEEISMKLATNIHHTNVHC